MSELNTILTFAEHIFCLKQGCFVFLCLLLPCEIFCEFDSIIITALDTIIGHDGLFLNQANYCSLQYCKISYGHATGIYMYANCGGAINCAETELNIINSTFTMNYASRDGGGLFIWNGSEFTIKNSKTLQIT